jgi:hypothetical protein
VVDFAQRFFSRVGVFTRYVVLRRQLAEIARSMEALNVADRRALTAHTAREFDLSMRQSREASTTNAGFARARSGNARVRLVGIAQWLTSAFRETEDSPFSEMQDLHRQLMRTMRLLRESAGGVPSIA